NSGDLLRILEIADIEYANAAEAVRACRRGSPAASSTAASRSGVPRSGRRRGRRGNISSGKRNSLRAAIDASIGGFGRHEQQMTIHRDIALTAGADEGGPQRGLPRVVDVIKIDAVVVSYKEMVAA